MSIQAEEWEEQALCRQVDKTDLWYPDAGQSCIPAQEVCLLCPVVEACRDFALRTNQTEGVWGALTPWQRGQIKKGLPVTLRELKPRSQPKHCLTCGSEVTGHALAKYCSKPCLRTAERERWNAKRRKNAA